MIFVLEDNFWLNDKLVLQFIHKGLSLYVHIGNSICRYRLAYSSNYSQILDPLIENNYQLFMLERLIMMGAKTFIKTFKLDETDLSLTDDPKKNNKAWQIPVYSADEHTC